MVQSGSIRFNPNFHRLFIGSPWFHQPFPQVGCGDAAAAQSLRAAPEGSKGSAPDESGEAEAREA